MIPTRLNPCFNGRYSQSHGNVAKGWDQAVLILVLMEDTLRAKPLLLDFDNGVSLNPCFNGRYSQRLYSLCSSLIDEKS